MDISSLNSDIEKIESGEYNEDLIIFHSDDINSLLNDFFSLYTLIEAAGGIVRNEQGDILFIYRLNKWDLPKGKIEDNEKIKDAAIREVKEETGLTNIKILDELSPTYHTYFSNGKRILKKTNWFEMFSPGNSELIPQLQEGITEVKWIKILDIDEALNNTYLSIKDVVSEYFNLKI